MLGAATLFATYGYCHECHSGAALARKAGVKTSSKAVMNHESNHL